MTNDQIDIFNISRIYKFIVFKNTICLIEIVSTKQMVFISTYSPMYLSLVLFNMITAIKVISVKIAPPKPTF